jgi:N-acetylneuraminic acid mutarotase
MVGLCSALAACDSAPTRDLTSPEPEAGTLDAQRLSLLAPSNTWATKTPMLAARVQAKAGTINNIIYVVGGRRSFDVGPTATVQAYNVASNSWSTRKSLPSARFNHNGASVINGRLYVAGGQNSIGE